MTISVREYGCLVASGQSNGLDRQVVSKADFDFLREAAIGAGSLTTAFRIVSSLGQEAVQVQSFIGIVALPSGEQLEIVPKITNGKESIEEGRHLLLKMLARVNSSSFLESGSASLMTLNRPWLESLIEYILSAIASLLRGGLRKDYVRIDSNEKFLRGQLRLAAQIRQRPGKQHHFNIRYDVYSANRPENRLLRSTLARLNAWTKLADSQRLCRELLFVMDEVPESQDFSADLRRWSQSREMARYSVLLPWIRLILTNRSPIFSVGNWAGLSLLFPMEKLFEEYVFETLRGKIQHPYVLRSQIQSESLVFHRDQSFFRLRPDLAIMHGKRIVSVLDTKWKLIDEYSNDSTSKYGLSQADFYQLFAYGEKYLQGCGVLFLIYPRHSKFQKALRAFHFSERLTLWVVPFDLTAGDVDWPADVDRELFEALPRAAALDR